MSEEASERVIQTTITMEELGELSQALGKYVRYLLKDETLRKNITDIHYMIIEEIADTEICLDKFKKMNRIEQFEIDKVKRYKKDRIK